MTSIVVYTTRAAGAQNDQYSAAGAQIDQTCGSWYLPASRTIHLYWAQMYFVIIKPSPNFLESRVV